MRSWWTEVSDLHCGIRRLVIYLDNGPKNSGTRVQFLKRLTGAPCAKTRSDRRSGFAGRKLVDREELYAEMRSRFDRSSPTFPTTSARSCKTLGFCDFVSTTFRFDEFLLVDEASDGPARSFGAHWGGQHSDFVSRDRCRSEALRQPSGSPKAQKTLCGLRLRALIVCISEPASSIKHRR